jgi:hypothetical protein
MDGATVDAWLYFPGIKGRTKLISILPFWAIFGGVYFKS